MLRHKVAAHLLSRLTREGKAAAEFAVAMLMTAGVISCGGEQLGQDGSLDANADAAPVDSGGESAMDAVPTDASDDSLSLEAAESGPVDTGFPETSSDADVGDAPDDHPIPEAPPAP
jgi:hypothetical protein